MNQQFNKEELHPVTFDPNNGCNVPDEVLLQQVAYNIRRQLPQAQPHKVNEDTVALVCGGPSLAKTEKELVKAVWAGAKVVAVNGAYQWCIDHNIKPSAMVMLDARSFNARFLETPVDGCKYLLASPCHPDAFDLCHDRDVLLWHTCSAGQKEYDLLKEFYFGRLFPIGIGTTVAIKSIQLMRLLGYKTFEIFGLDSCWMGDVHHAYPQVENDKDKLVPIWLNPEGYSELAERFFCAPWMVRQAVDFQKLVHDHGNMFRLNIHGDGLIAATMRIAAKLGSQVNLTEEGE